MTTDVMRTFVLRKMDECDELPPVLTYRVPIQSLTPAEVRRWSRRSATGWPGLALPNSTS